MPDKPRCPVCTVADMLQITSEDDHLDTSHTDLLDSLEILVSLYKDHKNVYSCDRSMCAGLNFVALIKRFPTNNFVGIAQMAIGFTQIIVKLQDRLAELESQDK